MTRVTQTWRYAFDNAPRVRSGSSRPERRERPNEVPVAIGDDELPVTNFARPRPVPPLFERNLDGVAGVSDAAIRAVDVIHLELYVEFGDQLADGVACIHALIMATRARLRLRGLSDNT
jgi:hypothetical protein